MKLMWVVLPVFLSACAAMPASASKRLAESPPLPNQFGGLDYEREDGVGIRTRSISLSAPDVERPASQDRRIIFNGSLMLQVADPDAAEKEARRAVETAKGWVHRIDGATFTLRVPSALFMDTVEALAKLGRVLDRKVAGTDVTEEYKDLQIRIDNAEKLRARIAALLDKAKDVKEALEVERELARVTEDLERLKGRLNAMSDAVTFSTIVVVFHRSASVRPASAVPVRFPFRWVRELGIERLTEVRQ